MMDWNRLRDLRDEVGSDDFEEVVSMFLDEAQTALARLEQADLPNVVEAELHSLKSSALNLGFTTLANLCGEGERAAGAGDRVDLGPIRSAFAISRAELAAGGS